MKKFFIFLSVALFATSCETVTKTAKIAETPSQLLSATVADLEVSPKRVTYTYEPAVEVRRNGLGNVKQAAIQEILQKENADVLVEAEYSIAQTRFLFRKKVKSITVSGRPAKYKNFRSLNDSVWCNPVFRARYKNHVEDAGGGLFK